MVFSLIYASSGCRSRNQSRDRLSGQLCDAPSETSMSERLDVLLGRPTKADSIARRPANFAESPEDPVDAFSEILSGVKLNGALFFSAELSAPWGFSTPAPGVIADEFAPGTER